MFIKAFSLFRYEIMDGAPVKGESIPIRVFLAGYDLTPTMRDINKKFSVKYYLNLVLVDEEERRYFKQQVHLYKAISHIIRIISPENHITYNIHNHCRRSPCGVKASGCARATVVRCRLPTRCIKCRTRWRDTRAEAMSPPQISALRRRLASPTHPPQRPQLPQSMVRRPSQFPALLPFMFPVAMESVAFQP